MTVMTEPRDFGTDDSHGRDAVLGCGFARAAATAVLLGLVAAAVLPLGSQAAPVYPTVTVTIYRAQALDAIDNFLEGSAADWTLYIGYRPAGAASFTWSTPEYGPDNTNDWQPTPAWAQSFQVQVDSVEVAIELCERDVFGRERADISSDAAVAFDCNSPGAMALAGGTFRTTYDLPSNTTTGDTTSVEPNGWLKTSGEFDGSTTTDENDANVFFSVTSNYRAPTANAGVDKTGFSGDTISFDGGGSTASAGSSIEGYEWDFTGDGAPDATGRVASWTFNTKGAHTVTLEVLDSVGNAATDTAVATIQNRAPVAAFAFSPLSPTADDNITFADTSTDPDGTIASWSWDFGDGTTSTLPNPGHRFSTNGAKTVGLTVTDNDGASTTVTRTVTVVNLPPVARFSFSPSAIEKGASVRFTDESTDRDGTVASWSWDFGDGSTSTTSSPTHVFTTAGTYQVELTVTDNSGGSNTTSKTVTVTEPLLGGGVGGIPSVLFWLLILVVIVVIIVVVVVAMKRK